MSGGRHSRPLRGVRRATALAVVVLFVVLAFGARRTLTPTDGADRSASPSPASPDGTPTSVTPTPSPRTPLVHERFPVSTLVLPLVDRSRTVAPPHSGTVGAAPRRLSTTVWFPDVAAPPSARFPLVVFAHGFDVSPLAYRQLLRSWAHAGFVVAAPSFPLTNPDAVGGVDEHDIVNQPRDVRFVITRVLAAGRDTGSPLYRLIDGSEVAVAGHSDGAETVMAVAYDTCCRDPRVDAAVILSGKEVALGPGTFYPPGSPPLLVLQGTADTVNPPVYSQRLFAAAPPPKYYVSLLGADHLGPFTGNQPYERVVEDVTRDFLDGFLKHRRGAARRIRNDVADAHGVATLRR